MLPKTLGMVNGTRLSRAIRVLQQLGASLRFVRTMNSIHHRIPGLFASSHAPPNAGLSVSGPAIDLAPRIEVECGSLGGYCNAVGIQDPRQKSEPPSDRRKWLPRRCIGTSHLEQASIQGKCILLASTEERVAVRSLSRDLERLSDDLKGPHNLLGRHVCPVLRLTGLLAPKVMLVDMPAGLAWCPQKSPRGLPSKPFAGTTPCFRCRRCKQQRPSLAAREHRF